jgi:hypothetical protein
MAKKNNSTYEAIRKIRGDWGNINPVTKVIPNKKKNYIPDEYDEFYSMADCNYDLEHPNADHCKEDDYYFEDWSDY